jgi:hypothetical protein
VSLKIIPAAVAAVLAVGCAGAQASTLTLGFDPTNTGAYNQVDESTYFVPRDSSIRLVGTLLDDNGAAGNSCFQTYTRTFVTDFAAESGISCPSDSAGGRWGWSPTPVENTQYKAVNRPDENNAPAESSVITLLTAPEVHWVAGFAGKALFEVLVNGDADEYAGTLQIRQGSRLVASRHIAGRDSDVFFKIDRRSRAKRLKRKASFTLTLIPDDRSRWVGMTANGRVIRGRQGDGGPIL